MTVRNKKYCNIHKNKSNRESLASNFIIEPDGQKLLSDSEPDLPEVLGMIARKFQPFFVWHIVILYKANAATTLAASI